MLWVLIFSYWNVNDTAWCQAPDSLQVLIFSYWNVNIRSPRDMLCANSVLIFSYWNVNVEQFTVYVGIFLSINLFILECKSLVRTGTISATNVLIFSYWNVNRRLPAGNVGGRLVLIFSYWNVNLRWSGSSKRREWCINLFILECKSCITTCARCTSSWY